MRDYTEKFWRDLENHEIMPPNSGCDWNGYIPTTALKVFLLHETALLFTKKRKFLLRVLNISL